MSNLEALIAERKRIDLALAAELGLGTQPKPAAKAAAKDSPKRAPAKVKASRAPRAVKVPGAPSVASQLLELINSAGTPINIQELISKTGAKPTTVRQTVQLLYTKGKIAREGRGVYLPAVSPNGLASADAE